MKRNRRTVADLIGSKNGVTLIELILIISLIAVLATIAMPSFMQWRQSILYRQAARDMVSILRNAKSRTIELNRQHRVKFDTATRSYTMEQGERANGSTAWPTVVQGPAVLPNGVNMNPNITDIRFNPNGTATWTAAGPPADTATVDIQDSASVKKYTVQVIASGRISVSR